MGRRVGGVRDAFFNYYYFIFQNMLALSQKLRNVEIIDTSQIHCFLRIILLRNLH